MSCVASFHRSNIKPISKIYSSRLSSNYTHHVSKNQGSFVSYKFKYQVTISAIDCAKHTNFLVVLIQKVHLTVSAALWHYVYCTKIVRARQMSLPVLKKSKERRKKLLKYEIIKRIKLPRVKIDFHLSTDWEVLISQKEAEIFEKWIFLLYEFWKFFVRQFFTRATHFRSD